MKLSMWILADWLWKYNPIIYIKHGEQSLRGVRLYHPEQKMEKQNVYLGRAQDFIGSGGDGVICVHEHDMLLLDTNDIDMVLNEIFSAFDFYNKWADDLTGSIEHNSTLQEIIDISSELFDESVIICDASYKVLSYSANFEKEPFSKDLKSILMERQNSLSKFTCVRTGLQNNDSVNAAFIANFPDFENRLIISNVFNFKKFLGQVLVVEQHHKISEGRLQLASTLGDIVAYWIRYNSEHISMRAEASIFKDLIENKNISREDAVRHLNQIGWRESDDKIVARLSVPNSSANILMKQLNNIGLTVPDSYLIIHEFSIVLIANLRITPMETLKTQLNQIIENSNYCCGVSSTFKDILDFRKYYNQTSIAIKYSRRKVGDIVFCEDYIMDYIYDIIRTNSNTIIMHPIVNSLKEYDLANKADLYNTLYQYLVHERNLVKTAESLGIHRNSLLYRLKKIKEISDDDFNESKIREYILMSFKLDLFTNKAC
ncbi:PucR C-terminal helix-turn-helix domain-containing protein [Acetitomaculum ruminis DSM 5522]|uniref:PucR C-terminal helix-turn-helix domain-containing protein n=1 Tax=Acetitomaculum ruminis DSM 5522 TaxID=1120918 RepID=A0A1I0WHW9_9FIRM|nr:PucR family transcriptional regulator [Acetitomaculum ruminis]SFA88375.1 PucR C-terminal helix-turn-helix domain-containing protein [Acetitomaculum ruminis DSM 5522]